MSASSTPLNQRIQAILLERNGEPIALLELQRLLRRQGFPVDLSRLRGYLSAEHYTALADDRYILRDQLQLADQPETAQSVFLINLPLALQNYVVLDLETSGTNPEQDQIIQIAALRVTEEQPVALVSWYVQCPIERFTPSLRRALHLDAEQVASITLAPPIDQVWPEVRSFIGSSCLVIHNARFDTQFLVRQDSSLSNPVVDTLELAYLVASDAPRHTLSDLALHLGVDLEQLPHVPGLPPGYVLGQTTLHNAITDIVVLYAVYTALLRAARALPQASAALIAQLLPEAFGAPLRPALLVDTLASNHAPPPPANPHLPVGSAVEVLDRLATNLGLRPRASQHEMVRLVDDALMGDRSLLIEAPTGTGKTLAYLLPAALAATRSGRRIALATAFKNLQDQLRSEVERLQASVPFQAQVLKGASSYLCLRNLDDAISAAESDDPERRFVLAFFSRWASLGATLDELPYWLRREIPATAQIEHETGVDTATCTGQRCPFYEVCHYYEAYRRGAGADVLLINQALWLANPALMPPFDALVVDEAHNLEDMATSALEESVGQPTLRRELLRLATPGTRRGALQRMLDQRLPEDLRTLVRQARQMVGQSLKLLGELQGTLGTFVAGCDERLKPEEGAQLRLTGAPARIYPTRWPLVQQALDQLWGIYLDPLTKTLDTIAQITTDLDESTRLIIEAVRDNLRTQHMLLDTILQARRSDTITWVEVKTGERDGSWAFYAAPLSVAPVLAERYRSLRSVILTSATLTTGHNDFRFFVDRLGLRQQLDADGARSLPPALPYKTNVYLGLPAYLTYTPAQATLQSFVEELAAELSLFFQFTDGRALTLFTARSRLEEVWQRSAPELEGHGIAVLAQREGASRQRLVEQFRTLGSAVLYGLKSFWEGVDIPGEALSFVVMEKLPYPALSDPVHSARRELVARQSGREFQDYLFPLMVIQFKQGFGRLLRHDTDRGAVVMYDRRVLRKSYLPQLLGALPGFQPRDVAAERSRRQFYELLAERLPGLLDTAKHSDLLDGLPEVLATDLEALIERLALPDIVDDESYETWRPKILEALQALYGFHAFRSPEQEAAFRAMLSGRDMLAVLPTGAGKSLTFQLPALLRRGVTIVCSPLIALMRDQIDKLHDRGIEVAAALVSGQSAAEREEIMERVRSGRVHLLYMAPERLRDPLIQHLLTTAPIRQIVVDEAHCVALWGPSFRPDFLVLPQIYALRSNRPPVAAFTATATPAISVEIEQGLALNDPVVVRSSIDRPELRLAILDRRAPYHHIRSKSDQIKRLMLLVQTADQRGEAMLIYTATTTEAEYLARLLQVAGYAARAYHGRMPVQERANVGELFMEGLVTIVVCTKAFGMGIDKPDIRYVVHFHIPGDLESYFQEVGRAGRDGQPAYGILLHHPSDERIQRFFIDQSRPDHELLRTLWASIGAQPADYIIDPVALCEELDTDEHGLRRAIYLLEQAGLIRRGPDVTIQASLTLLGSWDEVAECVPAETRNLFRRLSEVLPDLAWSPEQIVLASLSEMLGCTPDVLEQALIGCSVAGGCLYRPWERGYKIIRLAAPETPLQLQDDAGVAMLEAKLERIRAFVNSERCRWQELRLYFGEPLGQPCGQCDRCAPHQEYPWSGRTGRDVPDVSDFLDLATTLLALADWNEKRSREGHSPFSARSLVRILRGDEFALMRYSGVGFAADRRRAELRACPYWGVCRTLRRPVQELDQLLERLVAERLLTRETLQMGDEASYTYFSVTDQGHARLLSGERLGW